MLTEFPREILQRLRRTAVVAGFSLRDIKHAVPVAEALLAGGIDAIELTLRTPAAMGALRAISNDVPEMLIGVGTILTPEMVNEVKAAGADFGVSPGLNRKVVHAAQQAGLPFAPGIATPSELESAIELGSRFVKLFPAEPMGGIPYLRAISAPYEHLGIEYFPLGGLNSENFGDYLAEPNVPAIGGSWIVKSDLVDSEDWIGITTRAAEVRGVLSEMRPKASTQNGAIDSAMTRA